MSGDIRFIVSNNYTNIVHFFPEISIQMVLVVYFYLEYKIPLKLYYVSSQSIV